MSARRGQVDPALSLVRSMAGRRGAQARWGAPMANDGSHQAGRRPGADSNRWYRMATTATGDRAVIEIYGEVGMWGITSAMFADELRNVTAGEIDLTINSPGGDIYDGVAIYTALLRHQSRINVYIDGLAASIASVIAQAGDHITIGRNAEMMIHDAWGMTVGNAAEHRAAADELDRHTTNIASIYAERSGRGTLRSWQKLMADETWFSAEEAVAAGLADEMTRPGRREPDAGNLAVSRPVNTWRDELSVYRYPEGRESAPAPEILAPTNGPVVSAGDVLATLDLTDEQMVGARAALTLLTGDTTSTTTTAATSAPPPVANSPIPPGAGHLALTAVRDALDLADAEVAPTQTAPEPVTSYTPPAPDPYVVAAPTPVESAEQVAAALAAADTGVAPTGTDPAPEPVTSYVPPAPDPYVVAAPTPVESAEQVLAGVVAADTATPPPATVEPVTSYTPPAPDPYVVAEQIPVGTAETVLASVGNADRQAVPPQPAPSPVTSYTPPAAQVATPPPYDPAPITSAEVVLAAIDLAAQVPGPRAAEPPAPDTRHADSIRRGFLEVLT